MSPFKACHLGDGEDVAHTRERGLEYRSGCSCLPFLMAHFAVEVTSNSEQYPIILKRHCMLCDEACGDTRARSFRGTAIHARTPGNRVLLNGLLCVQGKNWKHDLNNIYLL
jgi:hypothetical protein